ncbi:hypothetical protein SAMN06893096_102411 [Geodermatophilus pulveris]|uniref:LysR substrate binding domain-containing protein n=1 Tax=Geodermatophilus pulveris TaxID=1564159 RepID=A0A239CFJ9_9ACTN|nr:hypothetical protein [Geodermatophilus pulveris]SNS18749.1 hypothetical protein SAMN06893096_102411 [Geodermatophilus pulveris]
MALLSAGNAETRRHSGVVTRPATGLGPSRLAVAWRRDDDRPVTAGSVRACTAVVRSGGAPVAP